MLQSCLLCETVSLELTARVLVLNSATDPFVPFAINQVRAGTITLAEDNITTAQQFLRAPHVRHVAFHDYIVHSLTPTMDVAVMNLLYQPGKQWVRYGIEVAARSLRSGGQLYVVGAKDRGILSTAKEMQARFGNVETLTISKGQRVVRSRKTSETPAHDTVEENLALSLFAGGKLDEGTRLLLEALQVRTTDEALDIGSGAGYIGLHIARLATKGQVTMVDASLAAVEAARLAVQESGLSNVRVLSSDGAQAVLAQRFDLVASNPPFHLGGVQTTAIAERFIRESAQVLRPRGRLYLVANRFLKYEQTIQEAFNNVSEVSGDSRYKVLYAEKRLERDEDTLFF
jgi:16S rRNA (guanine1207-N2)-methyltransferase